MYCSVSVAFDSSPITNSFLNVDDARTAGWLTMDGWMDATKTTKKSWQEPAWTEKYTRPRESKSHRHILYRKIKGTLYPAIYLFARYTDILSLSSKFPFSSIVLRVRRRLHTYVRPDSYLFCLYMLPVYRCIMSSYWAYATESRNLYVQRMYIHTRTTSLYIYLSVGYT